jgi:glycosyltransferase involved in cell wall biosynthesis
VVQYLAFFVLAFVWAAVRHPVRRYDLVYAHNMPNFLVFAGLVPKLFGAKTLLDVHDPVPELLAAVGHGGLPPALLRLARAEERVSLKLCNGVITVNEPMRLRLEDVIGAAVPISVVMNLPDPSIFSANASSAASEDGARYLVYSGTVTLRHGIDLAIEAFARLAGRFPTLRLRVVGAGPALEPARDLAARLGVADRVDFMGHVTLEQIHDLVGGAVAALAPHRDNEFGALVFSVKVAEYLVLGLPVVCARTAAMSYYFSEDELFFFKPGDVEDLGRAIQEALSDSECANERSRRGKKKVEQLNWSMQVSALSGAVESLCAI